MRKMAELTDAMRERFNDYMSRHETMAKDDARDNRWTRERYDGFRQLLEDEPHLDPAERNVRVVDLYGINSRSTGYAHLKSHGLF